jgi:hypothetical protein
VTKIRYWLDSIGQPDALPDAANWSIPTLLAVGHLAESIVGKRRPIIGWIFDAHQKLVLTRSERIGDVELKGQVAAFVFANQPPVQPNLGEVIDCAEV